MNDTTQSWLKVIERQNQERRTLDDCLVKVTLEEAVAGKSRSNLVLMIAEALMKNDGFDDKRMVTAKYIRLSEMSIDTHSMVQMLIDRQKELSNEI